MHNAQGLAQIHTFDSLRIGAQTCVDTDIQRLLNRYSSETQILYGIMEVLPPTLVETGLRAKVLNSGRY